MAKDNIQGQDVLQLPVVPLRGVLAFPSTMLSFDVGRNRSVSAVELAAEGDKLLFVVAQRDAAVEKPQLKDLYSVGTVVKIRQVMRLPDGAVRVMAEGQNRGLLLQIDERGDHQDAYYIPMDENKAEPSLEMLASMRIAKRLSRELLRARGELPAPELMQAIEGERESNVLCELIAANLLPAIEDKQAVLECIDPLQRLETVLRLLSKELQLTALEDKIQQRVHESMDKANRDYYLREQIHAIQEELEEEEDEEILELRKKLAESPISGEARDRVERELKRLARISIHAPESSVSENYIEYMLELPWGKAASSEIRIDKARKVLEEDHYGMKDVKERLIEYLAVRSVKGDLRSPILCLVGPPGVGKTSIARSVARALGRKFAQMSLGGVHDEAEIRGHRKTYIGAMPGRIISAIRQCESMNPVFLLDEIDKMASDFRGDPASAMLEVLDPEQNHAFRDHYLEAPFDLSDVLFITTANTTDTIDRALLDRMEIIEVPSYTLEEKLQIAKRHLLPKQLKEHGLKKSQLRLGDKALRAVIDLYTRESGVRTLERTIAKLCRKAMVQMLEDSEIKSVSVKPDKLTDFLGAVKFPRKEEAHIPQVGVVNGLAWTRVGGEVMPVEALALEGTGAMELTGSLGDVMKESAHLARSIVRERLRRYGVEADFFRKHDVHIHVPEGAVPKDGPSAGVALSCALLSAVTSLPLRGDVAMTGEVTLHGKVLPIGGVKEKLLAAYRLGLTHILLPRENSKDLEEIDAEIRDLMDITLLDTVDEAFAVMLIAEKKAEIKVAV